MTTAPRRGRVVFVGAVHEAEPALRALLASDVEVVAVVTLTPELARATAGFVDLASIAEDVGVPVVRARNVNDPDLVARLAGLEPDLGVVVGWTRLLHDPVLKVPRHGWIGFHASMLPRDRGRAPVNWAIIHGDTSTGNTMMLLSPGTDTGDIVDQREVPIGPDDTCADVYGRVADAGAAMLRDHLPALLEGTAPRRSQAGEAGNVLPKRTPDMGVVDWHRPPRAVHDWVRALTRPYPGAFSCLDGSRVRIWAAERPLPDQPEEPVPYPPGTLLGADADGVRVMALDGWLRVTEVQEDTGPVEPAAAWFARRGLRCGARFDELDPRTARWAIGLSPAPADADRPYPLPLVTGATR